MAHLRYLYLPPRVPRSNTKCLYGNERHGRAFFLYRIQTNAFSSSALSSILPLPYPAVYTILAPRLHSRRRLKPYGQALAVTPITPVSHHASSRHENVAVTEQNAPQAVTECHHLHVADWGGLVWTL